MTRIIIFGTGSSGQRAWQAASGLEGVEVVAFADNDARKHGTTVNGRPVVAPAGLRDMDWDYIVLASQWASEIANQLTQLGVQRERILRPSLDAMRVDLAQSLSEEVRRQMIQLAGGRIVATADLPRVLLLTYETLNESHGTGVMLLRYFRDFPRPNLFSLCHLASGKPALEQSALLDQRGALTAESVRRIMDEHRFVPDLVYATAFNENDLPLLSAVVDALPVGTPVIQHFMDYMPHDAAAFDRVFRLLLPRVSQVWALTASLRDTLAEKYQHPVEYVSCLHQTLPKEWRIEHSPYRAGFRTVLLGNPWQPWIIPFLADVWGRCRTVLPGLHPIEWYCHPLRVQALFDAGYDPGFEIVWRGFVPDLQNRLRSADLAVIPFNMETQVSSHYAKGSVPSRITELAAAGLPLFAIASPDSGLAGFIGSRRMGRCAMGPDAESVSRQLIAFVQDHAARAAAGLAARQTAEREFQLEPFQKWLIGRMLDLATQRS